MGGIISGYYAVVYPERVKSMILINPIPAKAEWEMNFDSKLDSLSLLIKKQNEQKFYSATQDSLKACWDYYALVARGYYPNPKMVRRMWGDVCNGNQANMHNGNKWHLFKTLGNWDITSQLKKVKAPVLIISGEQDELIIACNVPGHRAAGMEAVVTIGEDHSS